MIKFFENFSNKLTPFIDNNLSNHSAVKSKFEELYSSLLSQILLYLIEGKFEALLTKDLDSLQERMSQLKAGIINNVSIGSLDVQQVYFDLIDPKISETFQLLLSFSKYIKNLVTVSHHITYKRFIFYETDYSELKEICEFLNLTIEEYLISDSTSFIHAILKLEKRIEESHAKYPFTRLRIFNAKLAFIKYKWKKRQKYNREIQQTKYGQEFSEKYIFGNGIVIDLDEKVLIGDPYFNIFEPWIEKIEFHYFNENSHGYYNIDINLSGSQTFDSYEIFYKIKYFKDIDENLSFFTETDKNFISSNTQIKYKEDFKKNYLYFKNNHFSFLVRSNIEYNSKNDKEILREYKNIRKISEKLSNNNYFIIYKFICYKLCKIEKLLNDKKETSLDKVVSEIAEIRVLINDCKSKFKWSKNSYNVIFQHDKKNSKIKIDGIEVYFPTSFLLPFSIVEYDLAIKGLEKKCNTILRDRQEATINKSLNSFKDELKTNERRSIEVISLFSAVISFIVGSISSYAFIESLTQAIMFLMIFGLSISVFVLLIFSGTRGWKFILKQIPFLSIPYLIIGYFLHLFIPEHLNDSKNKLSPKTEILVNRKIDSLERKLKIRIDSIRKPK
ncbi:hypothetical protein AAW12_18980 [Sphingobacterium sp. Ag1]|uniref:hypothetical protein n=1 Tax=Sphingobacterium sp. Ag1 TaxID=1643451 RepID=UPI0006282606|nr:hypothetical protein [Sphingobacterium sp. Ag1]KKO89688.1 hypothetical protein AAW12_18980 [Sphingobacterium sp. Ag1]